MYKNGLNYIIYKSNKKFEDIQLLKSELDTDFIFNKSSITLDDYEINPVETDHLLIPL